MYGFLLVFLVTLSLKLIIFEIFDLKKCCDLENRVRGADRCSLCSDRCNLCSNRWGWNDVPLYYSSLLVRQWIVRAAVMWMTVSKLAMLLVDRMQASHGVDGIPSDYHHQRHCLIHQCQCSMLQLASKDAFRMHVSQLLHFLPNAKAPRHLYNYIKCLSALRAYVQHKTNLKVITRMKIRSKIMSITQSSSMIRGSELVLWLADQILSLHKVLLPSQPLVNHRPLVGTKSAAWWPKQHGVRNFPKLFVLFVCLGFNGTFSTNRLYHAITVGQYIT